LLFQAAAPALAAQCIRPAQPVIDSHLQKILLLLRNKDTAALAKLIGKEGTIVAPSPYFDENGYLLKQDAMKACKTDRRARFNVAIGESGTTDHITCGSFMDRYIWNPAFTLKDKISTKPVIRNPLGFEVDLLQTWPCAIVATFFHDEKFVKGEYHSWKKLTIVLVPDDPGRLRLVALLSDHP
jgi:hypothetical protein